MSNDLHPFTEPLGELTIEELDDRYIKLMNRWRMARRMQMNEAVMFQLDLLISGIEDEKSRRMKSSDDIPNGVVLDTDPIKIDHKRRFT
jgi:hypothetical protein